MDKWAFFLDIDGTTAVDGVIPDENIAVINSAVKNGHYVFLCTGRPYSTSKHLLDKANWSGIICSMGAEIIVAGVFIRKETVSESFAKAVAEEFFKTDFWAVMGNGETLLSLNDEIMDIKEFSSRIRGITKIDMSPDISGKIKKLISEEMDIIYHPTYSEASIKGISKAEGIEFVLDKLNLDREFSVAVGDSLNDIDMIKYAGIGVAMGNAIDEVKAVADRVTDTCKDCGVAKIIREITGV